MQAKYSYVDRSKETIVYKDQTDDHTSLEALPAANSGAKANRKWHDKFKAGRT